MKALESYQHPPTYVPTGNVEQDFKYSFEAYDEDIAPYLPDDKACSILDVGCGWGQCLCWLKQRGYTDLTGIDIGSAQQEQGRKLGINVVQVDDPIAYLESKEASFDLVLVNHVIEHVDPDTGLQTLKSIHDALRSHGRIIVQTPNMNAIGALAGRYIEISHVTGYTESNLSQLVGLAGFDDVEVFGGHTPFSYRPKRLAWICAQKTARLVWRLMLVAEHGSDAPRVIEKNLYVSGTVR